MLILMMMVKKDVHSALIESQSKKKENPELKNRESGWFDDIDDDVWREK